MTCCRRECELCAAETLPSISTLRERADAKEYGDDRDGDTIPDHLDTDSDGDTIPDSIEGTLDRRLLPVLSVIDYFLDSLPLPFIAVSEDVYLCRVPLISKKVDADHGLVSRCKAFTELMAFFRDLVFDPAIQEALKKPSPPLDDLEQFHDLLFQVIGQPFHQIGPPERVR